VRISDFASNIKSDDDPGSVGPVCEGLKLKDVVNLALHEFFERRQYLPAEAQ
jgi:hypothetical protein